MPRSRQPRHGIAVPARLRAGARLFQLVTADFSAGGAKLLLASEEEREVLTAGTLVLVNASCLAQPKLAEVVWQRDGQFGVRFSEPLSPAELQCLLNQERTIRRDSMA